MKEIYEVKCMHYESGNSKSIVAYANIDAALLKMKKLNAQYGENRGDPYFVQKR